MAKLMSACENWKHILSNLGSSDCFVESLHEGIDFRVSFSRARFEMLMSSKIQDYLQPVFGALKKANLEADKITHVRILFLSIII
jgi:molecular chaperone DnaK (HSP70)